MAILTITTTAAHAGRVSVAFGTELGLGRNATNAEVKAKVIEYIKGVVFAQEDIATKAAIVTPQITPT